MPLCYDHVDVDVDVNVNVNVNNTLDIDSVSFRLVTIHRGSLDMAMSKVAFMFTFKSRQR
jgi:hypothetical protein